MSIPSAAASVPSFTSFDSTNELWPDYWSRFQTYVAAHSIPESRLAQVFLTNQTAAVYKLLSNLAEQQQSSKSVQSLSIQDIVDFMKEQYDSKYFTVRERYKFWSGIKRRPAETIQELAARIRQQATTCDFTSITNPLDEAMRTNFVCSVNSEAILKAVFRIKEDELTFSKAVQIATEVEDAMKVAKETVYGSPADSTKEQVHKVHPNKSKSINQPKERADFSKKAPKCFTCGKGNHV